MKRLAAILFAWGAVALVCAGVLSLAGCGRRDGLGSYSTGAAARPVECRYVGGIIVCKSK